MSTKPPMMSTPSDPSTLPVPESIQALELQIERALMYTHNEDPSKSDIEVSDKGETSAFRLASNQMESSDDIIHQIPCSMCKSKGTNCAGPRLRGCRACHKRKTRCEFSTRTNAHGKSPASDHEMNSPNPTFIKEFGADQVKTKANTQISSTKIANILPLIKKIESTVGSGEEVHKIMAHEARKAVLSNIELQRAVAEASAVNKRLREELDEVKCMIGQRPTKKTKKDSD